MSYQIKSNLPVSGSHWGLVFRDGVAVTENRSLAERLKERGYEVSEIVNDAVSVVAPAKSEAVTAEEVAEPIQEPVDIEPEPEPATLACPKCGKEYKSEPALKKHIGKCEAE